MRPAVVLAAGLVAVAGVLLAIALAWDAPDQAAQAWVADHVGDGAQAQWRSATWPGETWLGLLVAVLAAVACTLPGERRSAVAIGLAAAANVLVVQGLKLLVGRERPEGHGVDGYAFPSGHAATAVAVYGLVVLVAMPALARRWPSVGRVQRFALGVWIGLALAIGLGRVLGGAHWATDVLAGWCLGGACVCLGVVLAGPREPAPAPQAA